MSAWSVARRSELCLSMIAVDAVISRILNGVSAKSEQKRGYKAKIDCFVGINHVQRETFGTYEGGPSSLTTRICMTNVYVRRLCT